MKPSMKRSIKYAAIKLAWFGLTITNATYLWSKLPLWSLEGISIMFLGGAAYVFGTEVIEQIEKGTIKW